MRSRVATRFAWSSWTLTVAFAVLSLPLAEEGNLIIIGPLAAWVITSSTVRTIIASRRPENPIGWILGTIGFVWASNIFSGLYAIRALVANAMS